MKYWVRQCTLTTKWYNHPQVSSHLVVSTMCVSKADWRASATTPWGDTPIIEDGGEHSLYWPPFFDIFLSHWVSFLCPTRSCWPPLFAEKISFSPSHIVPEIIWPKVGLMFHQNLSFNYFKSLYTNFLLIFSILLTPFFTVLNLFDPFLQIFISNWVHFFITSWTPTQCFVNYPLPPWSYMYNNCFYYLGVRKSSLIQGMTSTYVLIISGTKRAGG